MSVTESTPYGVPARPEEITITIALSAHLRTPKDVCDAVTASMEEYTRNGRGMLMPFSEQPGYPQGLIRNPWTGVIAGEWRVTS